MKRAKCHAALLVLVFLGCVCLAQHDSLLREDDVLDPGLTWELAGGFFPHGSEGVALDEQGDYYQFIRFTGERQLSFSAIWRSERGIRIGMAMKDSLVEIRELRAYADRECEVQSSVSQIIFASYCEFRVAPRNLLDPRVRIAGTAGRGIELAASVSHVFDPTALACMVGVEGTVDYPHTWLNVTLSAGLVANSRVSLSVVGQWSVPLEGAGLPTSVLSLHSRYSLDYEAHRTLQFRLALSTLGPTTWLGFGCSIRMSSP